MKATVTERVRYGTKLGSCVKLGKLQEWCDYVNDRDKITFSDCNNSSGPNAASRRTYCVLVSVVAGKFGQTALEHSTEACRPSDRTTLHIPKLTHVLINFINSYSKSYISCYPTCNLYIYLSGSNPSRADDLRHQYGGPQFIKISRVRRGAYGLVDDWSSGIPVASQQSFCFLGENKVVHQIRFISNNVSFFHWRNTTPLPQLLLILDILTFYSILFLW